MILNVLLRKLATRLRYDETRRMSKNKGAYKKY